MDELTVTLSGGEVSFLASLLGADTLLGVSDPFPGWLTEEIEDEWERVRASLEERNFIESRSDEEIIMDTGVAALVGACAFPEASFVITHTGVGEQAWTRYLHVADELVVEQLVVAPEPSSTYRLTALQYSETGFQRTLEIFDLTEQEAVTASSGRLLQTDLAEARDLAAEAGQGAVEAALRETGLTASTVSALVETLLNPVANGSLVAMRQREGVWDVAGVGFLEGANGLWRLRPFTQRGQDWVEVTPAPAAEVREQIRRVMNRVLPTPPQTE